MSLQCCWRAEATGSESTQGLLYKTVCELSCTTVFNRRDNRRTTVCISFVSASTTLSLASSWRSCAAAATTNSAHCTTTWPSRRSASTVDIRATPANVGGRVTWLKCPEKMASSTSANLSASRPFTQPVEHSEIRQYATAFPFEF